MLLKRLIGGSIALFLTLTSVAQKIEISPLRVQAVNRDSLWVSDILFPFMESSNDKAAQAANYHLCNFFVPDYLTGVDRKAISQSLQKAGADYLASLNYEVTFKSEKLLSLKLTFETIGAHASTETSYFVFDRQTGKNYSLSEFIEPGKQDGFSDMVRIALADSSNAAYAEAVQMVNAGVMNSSESESMKQFLEECDRDLDGIRILRGLPFYIKANTIMIPSNCYFPHALKALEPIFSIPFQANSIKEFLQPWVYQQLISKGSKK